MDMAIHVVSHACVRCLRCLRYVRACVQSLGIDIFDDARALIKRLVTWDLELRDKFIERLNEEERFRLGEFATHLGSRDSCAHHCMCLLLSSNYPHSDLYCECIHDLPDGEVPEIPAEKLTDTQRCAFCHDTIPSQSHKVHCRTCRSTFHKTCLTICFQSEEGEVELEGFECMACINEKRYQNHTKR